MKIDVTQKLKTINGNVMQDVNEEGVAIEATLRTALINATLAPDQGDDGVKKLAKYRLAMKIQDSDEVEFTAEEIVSLKEAVGKVFPSPLIVGQVTDILEGNK